MEKLWSNFKLLGEEQIDLNIGNQADDVLEEKGRVCLLGRLHTNRPFNRTTFKSTMKKRVLEGMPWSFDNHLLLLTEYLRVRILLDVDKALLWGMTVRGTDGTKFIVYFRYERLPNVCYFCGCFGHGERDCLVRLGDQSSNKGPLQYGPWLRALGEKTKKVVQQKKTFTEVHQAFEQGTTMGGEMGEGEDTATVDATIMEVGDNPRNSELMEHVSMMIGGPDTMKMGEQEAVTGESSGFRTVDLESNLENLADKHYLSDEGPNKPIGPDLMVDQLQHLRQDDKPTTMGNNEFFSPHIHKDYLQCERDTVKSKTTEVHTLTEVEKDDKSKGKGVLVEDSKGRKNLKNWKRQARAPNVSAKTKKEAIVGNKRQTANAVHTMEVDGQSSSKKRVSLDQV
ncbi:unnamed protein product [Ilex paraguariensis]|uniref:CCHC-type domain-containing protein n=2 Tax=Ilex paraguariensis TaxID=185542 RepID=A0ABC8RAM4_9AQUA